MKINLVGLFLSATILLGAPVVFSANQTDETASKTFLPDELILKNCMDNQTINKISQINLMFKEIGSSISPSNFKQKLLTLIDKNKLTDTEINNLISKSKNPDLCGANANLALSFYNTTLEIAEPKKEKNSNISKYMDKALVTYRKYANQGSIGAIKLLCVPDHWVVEAVDPNSKETCQKALYLKGLHLSTIEKARMFTAVYNAYWLPLQKNLSQRAEICSDFSNDENIMDYSNNMLHQRNKDMCNVEFIQYGEKLFTSKNYQEAFRYLLIIDQSLNTTGIPQFELGYMYQTGTGIPQNYSLARDWYIKACDKGNSPEAQYNLGMMYMNGYGVLQNYTIAHALYNMASANGIKDAARVRDTLARKMTVLQIEKAQELASNWIKNWPSKLSA